MSASNCNSSVGAVLRTSRQRKTTNAIGNDVVCITSTELIHTVRDVSKVEEDVGEDKYIRGATVNF